MSNILYELERRTSLQGRWYDHSGEDRIDGTFELDNGQVNHKLPAEYKKENKPIHLVSLKDFKEFAG